MSIAARRSPQPSLDWVPTSSRFRDAVVRANSDSRSSSLADRPITSQLVMVRAWPLSILSLRAGR
jgi:hypothetical protein